MTTEKAILAGGCFWGVQELIRHQPGVIATKVGYTGGHMHNPTYEDMKAATSGHAEAIEIVFDPTQVSYQKLLEFFFQIHDPTTSNQQGNDIGPSYRSAIFYLSEEQKKTAEDLIASMTVAYIWPRRITTEVVAATTFYDAERYHQDYLQRNPSGYNCHYIRPDWALDKKKAKAS